MRRLYFIKTNGGNMLVSIDEDNNCRYLHETDDFPIIFFNDKEEQKRKALEFMETVEDDSSWNDDCTYYQLFEEFPVEFIAEIEKEL